MNAVNILVLNGLVTAGNSGDSGFEAWNMSPAQATERILAECEIRDWSLGLTDVWLAATEKGDELALLVNAEGPGVLDGVIRGS